MSRTGRGLFHVVYTNISLLKYVQVRVILSVKLYGNLVRREIEGYLFFQLYIRTAHVYAKVSTSTYIWSQAYTQLHTSVRI